MVGIVGVDLMEKHEVSSDGRRAFIAKCGRFALVTPPTIALMLSADGRNYARAGSGDLKETEKEKKPKKVKKPKKTK